MFRHAYKLPFLCSAALVALVVLAGPAQAETESSFADVLAGTAVPQTVKLKDLTSEWRRITIGGDWTLGMGGMMQSMMQSVGSMFGGAVSDTLYTRGATLRMGSEQFLIGYRLPSPGIDFSSLMAMGAGAGAGGPGAAPKMPERKPVTPETELSLTLINLRAIASLSDIRPFDMAEAMKPPAPGLLDSIFQKSKEKAEATSAASNMKQLALALQMYVQDYDEKLPPMQSTEKFKKVLMPYCKNETVFKSPSTGKPFRPNPQLSGRSLAGFPSRTGVIAIYSAIPEPDGSRIVARLDGSVRTISAAEWGKVAKAQKLPPD